MDIAIIILAVIGIIIAIVVGGYVESTLFIRKYSNDNYKKHTRKGEKK